MTYYIFMPQKPSSNAVLAKRFGAALRARRKALGLSQSDVALSSNVSIMFLSRLERGQGGADLDMALRVAQAVGYDILLAPR